MTPVPTNPKALLRLRMHDLPASNRRSGQAADSDVRTAWTVSRHSSLH